MGRTEEPGLRRGGQTELRGVGLAEDDEPGLLETHDHFGVMVGNKVAKALEPKVVIVPAREDQSSRLAGYQH